MYRLYVKLIVMKPPYNVFWVSGSVHFSQSQGWLIKAITIEQVVFPRKFAKTCKPTDWFSKSVQKN